MAGLRLGWKNGNKEKGNFDRSKSLTFLMA